MRRIGWLGLGILGAALNTSLMLRYVKELPRGGGALLIGLLLCGLLGVLTVGRWPVLGYVLGFLGSIPGMAILAGLAPYLLPRFPGLLLWLILPTGLEVAATATLGKGFSDPPANLAARRTWGRAPRGAARTPRACTRRRR